MAMKNKYKKLIHIAIIETFYFIYYIFAVELFVITLKYRYLYAFIVFVSFPWISGNLGDASFVVNTEADVRAERYYNEINGYSIWVG